MTAWGMPDDEPLDHPFSGFSPEVIEKLRTAHSLTPLHQVLALSFVPGDEPGSVVVEMPVAPGAFNGSGNLHGGAIEEPTVEQATVGGFSRRTCRAGRG